MTEVEPGDSAHRLHLGTETVDSGELLLLVEVAGRRFALRSVDVIEVHRIAWVSPLPDAPRSIEGVVDIRGEIVPVVDLRHRLGAPAAAAHPDDRLVVVAAGHRRIALHVDHGVDLMSAEVSEIDRAVLPEVTYASGLVRRSDGVVVVHDVEAFLSAEELSALDDALAACPR